MDFSQRKVLGVQLFGSFKSLLEGRRRRVNSFYSKAAQSFPSLSDKSEPREEYKPKRHVPGGSLKNKGEERLSLEEMEGDGTTFQGTERKEILRRRRQPACKKERKIGKKNTGSGLGARKIEKILPVGPRN